MPANGQLRGIVRSLAEVTVTADLSAPVTRAPFKKGEVFQKGDVLLEFDCRRYREDLAGAEADSRAGQAFLKSQTEMAGRGAAGRNDVEIAEAKYDKARAVAQGLAIRMEQCTIRAPFDGAVRDISARAFETPQPGTPLIKIIGGAQLEIGIVAPSKSLAWLKAGMEFQFLADETGETHRAAIARFGAAADPVSQTIEVIAVFLDAPRKLLPGMSGTALFSKPSG